MKFLKSIKYALQGFAEILKENNFQIDIVFLFIVTSMTVVFKISRTELLLLIVCFAFALSAEAVNTIVEKICDLITIKKDERVRIIKDMSAAYVLLIDFFIALIGLFIFIPKIINIFK